MHRLFFVILLTCIACGIFAVEIPAGGSDLGVGPKLYFTGKADRAQATQVEVTDGPGPQAWCVEAQRSDHFYDIQIMSTIPTAVRKGDVGLLSVWLKCESVANEQGEASVVLYIQRGSAPYNKSTTQAASVGKAWTQFLVPFAFDADYAAGTAQVGVGIGNSVAQTVLVGPVTLLNYGSTKTMSELPRTSSYYTGREPDAPWRADAAKRIDELRKGDLTIHVLNADGSPVPDAQVRVTMTRHAFPFGTAVVASRLTGSSPDNQRYQKEFLANFNAAVTENDLKWPPLSGDWGDSFNPDATKAGLHWIHDHHIFMRGHVMVWPSWRNSPKALKALADKPTELRTAIEQHIDDVSALSAGLVNHWDVVNETFDNHDLTDILGQESLAWWFERARAKNDPLVRLYINDYGILATGGDLQTEHQAHYEATIRALVDAKAPVEGIGMQSHFGGRVTPPTAVWTILDRFAAFKLPISVTEFDINTDDDSLRADYTRDFLTACFAHPSIEAFICWGFWEGAHWKKNAAMFAQDWTLRDNGKVWQQLIYHDWWTNVQAKTDAKGECTARGFLGEHEVVVVHNGQTIRVPVRLLTKQTALTVTIPEER